MSGDLNCDQLAPRQTTGPMAGNLCHPAMSPTHRQVVQTPILPCLQWKIREWEGRANNASNVMLPRLSISRTPL